MRKSIIELLNQEFNLKKEYVKLYKLFKEECFYEYDYGCDRFTLFDLFNSAIGKWKYRGTCSNLKEILEKLELYSYCYEEDNINEILKLIDLIKNAEFFCDKVYIHYTKGENVLLGNIDVILNSLGYTVVERDSDSVQLIKKDADALATALEVDNALVSRSILDYMDFRIEKDLESKKSIILKLADYLEPERNLLRQLNNSLEDQIFYNLNNLQLRHNNLKGKYKKDFIVNMPEDELLAWYDKTYGLILTAIRLIEFNNNKKEYQNLKKNIG